MPITTLVLLFVNSVILSGEQPQSEVDHNLGQMDEWRGRLDAAVVGEQKDRRVGTKRVFLSLMSVAINI